MVDGTAGTTRSGKAHSYLAGKWGQENFSACHFPAPIFLPEPIMPSLLANGVSRTSMHLIFGAHCGRRQCRVGDSQKFTGVSFGNTTIYVDSLSLVQKRCIRTHEVVVRIERSCLRDRRSVLTVFFTSKQNKRSQNNGDWHTVFGDPSWRQSPNQNF